jgi:hypothetical protein
MGTEAQVNRSQGLDGDLEESRNGRPHSVIHDHGMPRQAWLTRGQSQARQARWEEREAVGGRGLLRVMPLARHTPALRPKVAAASCR